MNNPLIAWAMSQIQRNPNVANNPQAKEFIDILQHNDQQRGQQMAENLCKTYGKTPEQAIAEAKKFFNIP